MSYTSLDNNIDLTTALANTAETINIIKDKYNIGEMPFIGCYYVLRDGTVLSLKEHLDVDKYLIKLHLADGDAREFDYADGSHFMNEVGALRLRARRDAMLIPYCVIPRQGLSEEQSKVFIEWSSEILKVKGSLEVCGYNDKTETYYYESTDTRKGIEDLYNDVIEKHLYESLDIGNIMYDSLSESFKSLDRHYDKHVLKKYDTIYEGQYRDLKLPPMSKEEYERRAIDLANAAVDGTNVIGYITQKTLHVSDDNDNYTTSVKYKSYGEKRFDVNSTLYFMKYRLNTDLVYPEGTLEDTYAATRLFDLGLCEVVFYSLVDGEINIISYFVKALELIELEADAIKENGHVMVSSVADYYFNLQLQPGKAYTMTPFYSVVSYYVDNTPGDRKIGFELKKFNDKTKAAEYYKNDEQALLYGLFTGDTFENALAGTGSNSVFSKRAAKFSDTTLTSTAKPGVVVRGASDADMEGYVKYTASPLVKQLAMFLKGTQDKNKRDMLSAAGAYIIKDLCNN